MTDLDRILDEAARSFGTPAFVYLGQAIDTRIAEIRAAFGQTFALSYAMKCNPNPGLLTYLADRIDYLDVSSAGELRAARDAGWDPGRASFTGPAKRDFEIEYAIASGVGALIVENLREARIADRIAGQRNMRQDVLIRLTPAMVPKGFGDHMAGRPSPFGIDIEDAPEQLPIIFGLPNLKVTGLHIYSGTQCLKPDAICDNYRIFMTAFREICDAHNIHPEKLVFGSGLGIPYHPGDTKLDLSALASQIAPELDAFRALPRFHSTKLVLELGRYLIGDAGCFLTSVIAIKDSRGQRIAMCDGGMNHHLPASGHFGMVIHRNYRMHVVGGDTAREEKVNLVGPLCTSIDRLANAVSLPPLKEGDVIAIHASGAYGLTASPIHFISHDAPREILICAEGQIDVSRPEFGPVSYSDL